jgi:hypothetical protein
MGIKDLIDEVEETNEESKELTKQFLKLPLNRQKAILTAAIEYEKMNQQEKLIGARRNTLFRPVVEGAVEAYGIEDQNGNLHLVMGEEDLEAEVIRTKRISRTINTVTAEELLKEKGLYETCIMQVVSWEFDEEKIIEAYEAGKLSAIELDSIMKEKVSWATTVNSNDKEIKKLKEARKEIEKSKLKEIPEIE